MPKLHRLSWIMYHIVPVIPACRIMRAYWIVETNSARSNRICLIRAILENVKLWMEKKEKHNCMREIFHALLCAGWHETWCYAKLCILLTHINTYLKSWMIEGWWRQIKSESFIESMLSIWLLSRIRLLLLDAFTILYEIKLHVHIIAIKILRFHYNDCETLSAR